MVNKILAEIKALGVSAEATTVNKNGVVMQGVTVGEGNVRPNFYIDYYEGTPEQIACQIVKDYKKIDVPQYDTEMFNSYDNVKDKLMLCIRHVVDDDVATIPFLDLQLYARIIVDENENGIATTPIKNELIDKWGVSTQQVIDDALACTKPKYTIASMFNILMGVAPEFANDFDCQEARDSMYVMNTTNGMYGASVIYCRELVRSIAEKLGGDVYIIPSSIHEIIVIPAGSMSANELSGMIREVNDTCVDPKEQLSTHAYRYSLENDDYSFFE